MILHHVTLLTGHVATHRADTFHPTALGACRALLPSGGPVPAFPTFRVEIDSPVFTIWRGSEPVATCGIGQGRDETWESLVCLQSRFGPVMAGEPPGGRWLAVALLPGLANLTEGDAGWLGDFERCLAAVMIASHGS